MIALRLLLLAASLVVFAGCESDVPDDPSTSAVTFGNNKPREAGNEEPAKKATDGEKTPW